MRLWRTLHGASVLFIETPVFTRQVRALLDDDEYADLQGLLAARPDYGDLIQRSGGLRKVRWSRRSQGRGKRGGVRVIYYVRVAKNQIYLVLAYSKSQRDDLTQKEKDTLRTIIERW